MHGDLQRNLKSGAPSMQADEPIDLITPSPRAIPSAESRRPSRAADSGVDTIHRYAAAAVTPCVRVVVSPNSMRGLSGRTHGTPHDGISEISQTLQCSAIPFSKNDSISDISVSDGTSSAHDAQGTNEARHGSQIREVRCCLPVVRVAFNSDMSSQPPLTETDQLVCLHNKWLQGTCIPHASLKTCERRRLQPVMQCR